jgi:hypothetical protein
MVQVRFVVVTFDSALEQMTPNLIGAGSLLPRAWLGACSLGSPLMRCARLALATCADRTTCERSRGSETGFVAALDRTRFMELTIDAVDRARCAGFEAESSGSTPSIRANTECIGECRDRRLAAKL